MVSRLEYWFGDAEHASTLNQPGRFKFAYCDLGCWIYGTPVWCWLVGGGSLKPNLYNRWLLPSGVGSIPLIMYTCLWVIVVWSASWTLFPEAGFGPESPCILQFFVQIGDSKLFILKKQAFYRQTHVASSPSTFLQLGVTTKAFSPEGLGGTDNACIPQYVALFNLAIQSSDDFLRK